MRVENAWLFVSSLTRNTTVLVLCPFHWRGDLPMATHCYAPPVSPQDPALQGASQEARGEDGAHFLCDQIEWSAAAGDQQAPLAPSLPNTE